MSNFKKYGLGVLSLVGGATLAVSSHVSAAADTDLVATLASTTTMVTDQKATILSFIVGIALIALVIGLAKVGIVMASKWIKGAFGGGRKRR